MTLIDSHHVMQHIDSSDEVREQIAFADVILLNKTDLVTPVQLDQLESRIHSMNAAAKIYRTRNAELAMERILNLGGFDLDRALQTDPKFLEPEYPFEWSGIYRLDAGDYSFVMNPGPDPAMNVTLIRRGLRRKMHAETVERAVIRFRPRNS